jgi:electron-transferring-flavoprotein dehydrogenase
MNRFRPADYQPRLAREQLILNEKPQDENVEMDVLFVGAGPAGLAGAIELAQLVKKDNDSGGGMGEVNIGVLEKAASLGEHCLSGAVVNPVALRELFPGMDVKDMPLRAAVGQERVFVLTAGQSIRIPTPPTMQNHGNYIASICELVRWLGEKAEALGANVFTGFPAAALLVEGNRVLGVRTTPSGLDRSGQPGSSFTPPTDIVAKVTALCEGTRGLLSQAYFEWQNIGSPNPQIFALGVKEIWATKKPLDAIIHTLGWPLPKDTFGGSFVYPLEPNVVAIGLVAGLDYHNSRLDVHALLQQMKQHPLFREYLENGELMEWGAKTIPEGGYYSLPQRRHGDGLLILGDAAGFVEVASLKGIHYAIQSGIYAARAIFDALKRKDTTAAALAPYDEMVNKSYIVDDLKRRRNMRLAFKDGFYLGGLKAGLMTITGGAAFGGKIDIPRDADVVKETGDETTYTPDKNLSVGKLDAVFKAGNATRDDIPSHLIIGQDVPPEVAEMYEHMCPAGVYERQGEKLVVNAPNCIDCKATDVLGPRWTPREGGSGPRYRRM